VREAIYGHQQSDPDISWLLQNYLVENPNSVIVDQAGVPLCILTLFTIGEKNLEYTLQPENIEENNLIEGEIILEEDDADSEPVN
jgi:hypothetical protein